jgi:hypothetical protein
MNGIPRRIRLVIAPMGMRDVILFPGYREMRQPSVGMVAWLWYLGWFCSCEEV